MNFFLGAGGAFLIAVLWMDLMFDVLVFDKGHARGPCAELPEERLAQIAMYYRRVTTTAAPMNHLVSIVMAAMVVMLGVELGASRDVALLAGGSLALCGIPISLALVRIFPNAVRLGTRRDDRATQSRLAREICVAHLACLASMVAFVGLRFYAA